MKNYILVTLGIALFACQKTQKTFVYKGDLVNCFIGTDGPGNTYPGATTPFGMVQLSPDIGVGGWDRIAGYFYKDTIISSFSHMHLTGTGAGDLYDIALMPSSSYFSNVPKNIQQKVYKANGNRVFSRFSHDREWAKPGYYEVDLLDSRIKVQLTATKRCGVHQYHFPKDTLASITLDLGFAMNWDKTTDTYIEIVNDTLIQGYRKSTGWAKDQRVYFVMTTSQPMKKYNLYQEGRLVQRSKIRDSKTKAVFHYDTQNQQRIIVKVALSSASIKGAYENYKEVRGKSFQQIKNETFALWQEQLEKIDVQTIAPRYDTLFYTMLYQSMLAPNILSDISGAYKGADGKIHKAKGFDRYDTFSLWDTYRASNPFYTIIHTDRVADMIASMLAHYKETGLLPVWSLQGNESNMMIGYHAVPVIVDAYFKGIPMDTLLAYEACKKSAMDTTRQIPDYIKLGYVPARENHENWSVSKTLEYAYDDWCIAQFAKDLGKEKDYKIFLKRSENWKNLYDESSTFMRPKNEKGSFIKPFKAKEYTPYFCESNAWHYFWYVPQNINGLIEVLGGKENFEKKLDTMFSLKPLKTDKLPIFSTGMIGQYAHGNEPSHHVAYLYNYVDKPHKTQQRIREILLTQYKNTPDGHCGNEDCGQMSSWYLFSALGFYPVNPANGRYVLGSPLVKKAVLHLETKKKFTIVTSSKTIKDKYVHKVLLNGKVLNRNYILHKEIMAGGTLYFEMKSYPATDKL